jgi:hypothetical protein
MSAKLGTDPDPVTGHETARHQPGTVDFGVLLGQVFVGEPPIGRGVAAVYQRADRMRRRRLQAVLAIGAVTAVLIAALGYTLTTAVVPDSAPRGAAAGAPAPAPDVDPVLMILRTAVGRDLRIMPREPSRGVGWRQYAVLSRASGQSRGLIEVSVYTAPDGICFPVLADQQACARPERAGDNVEYARYGSARDVDWQVYQAMARRLSDGRVLTVMTTGERGTGDADAGRPPLTALQTAILAADSALMSAFGSRESCDGPGPACPLLFVPVPPVE